MITRENAIDVLYEIVNSGILSEELEDDIQDIICCIEDEKDLGIHAWGMPDDEYSTLHTALRTDLPEYADFKMQQEEILDYYKFSPSKAEES